MNTDVQPATRIIPNLTLPRGPVVAWVVTAAMTILAAAIRLSDLRSVATIIFDETYYVKDGWALITMGYEGKWADDQNDAFAAGDLSGLSADGSYIVHPPVGKFLIGVGMRLFGQDNPFGWRVMVALAGIVGVFLVCRLAWNLFGSVAVTLLAGLFLATDGIHVSMSRTGLLDIFLSTFVLAAFLAVVKDQQRTGQILEGRLALWRSRTDDDETESPSPWGPTAGFRPWLIVAGILLGLACGTKWSGIYAVTVLGLFVVFREMLLRRRYGIKHWILASIAPDGIGAFFAMVVTAAAVYLASWTSWFLHPKAWGHSETETSLLDLIGQWVTYHQHMWGFHTGLSSEHDYQSNPLSWLLQIRPTSFHYEGEVLCADGSDCVSAVFALGNPLLWWSAIPAILLLLWVTFRRKNWQTGLVLCGFLAMYVPWFLYLGRTVFAFYTVAFVPYVALAVAWMIGWMGNQVGARKRSIGDRRTLAAVGFVLTGAILACAFWFAPLWTGHPIPYEFWHQHMWFDSWI